MPAHDDNDGAPTNAARRGRWRIAGWIVILVALNLAWRTIRYALGFAIWGDESFLAVSVITRDFLGMMQPLEYNQIAPLLFLWIEWIAGNTLGWSEWSLRLAPFAAGVASMLLFVPLAHRAVGRHAGLVAVGIFAASYYPVRHAAEIKPYATDLLAALAVLVTAVPLLSRAASRGQWVAFAGVSAIGVWMSYPSVFVSGGALAVLAAGATFDRDARGCVRAVLAGGLVVGSFVAMYVFFGAAHQASGGPSMVESDHWSFTFPPVAEPWRLPLWFVNVHTGNMFAYPNGGNRGGSTGTFVLFVIGAVALWRRAGGRDRRTLMLLLAPLPLLFVAAALQKYPYGGSARVALHMAPAICLIAASGLLAVGRWFLKPRDLRGAIPIALIVFGAMIVVGVVRDVREPFKKFSDRESKRLIHHFAETTPPGSQWIVFGSYNGPSPDTIDFIPWGGTVARLRFNIERYVDVPVTWGPSREDLATLPRVPTWLIVYHDDHKPFPQDVLDAFMPAMMERFGEPMVETYKLEPERPDHPEALVVYKFEP